MAKLVFGVVVLAAALYGIAGCKVSDILQARAKADSFQVTMQHLSR